MVMVRPSTPTAVMALFVTESLSGETPPESAANQFTTEKKLPASTTASNGFELLSEHRTVFKPVGCVFKGTSTKDDTSTAPLPMVPGLWKLNVLFVKSNSVSNFSKKLNPSIPPTTAGNPVADKSVTTALRLANSSDPRDNPEIVVFWRIVSPMEPKPLIAAPSAHRLEPSVSRSFGDIKAVVAPVSMRKSTNPESSPQSNVTNT
mmetsp:Transcript_1267/g.4826  ORF Transcript_1267/g.4826 Transcript_1267/m.4826 type:complete len:205 (-) Transcript_1267:466-1080(-)